MQLENMNFKANHPVSQNIKDLLTSMLEEDPK